MTAPIGPGDWVECVNVTPCRCGCSATGIAYRIGDVFHVVEVCQHIPHSHGVVLEELPTPAPHHCFPARDFKPIYRRDESLIQRLLQPIPAEPDRELAST